MDRHPKYQHLFFDLDHTLWDFEANSKNTLYRVFEHYQLDNRTGTDFDFFHATYKVHNLFYWNQYTKGLIGQDELRWARMVHTLAEFGIQDEELAKNLGRDYLLWLPENAQLFPYTKEILIYLKDKKYDLHILSNGFEEVQHKKLIFSGIHAFFSQVITSEACKQVKPNKEIFEYALGKSGARIDNSIMIGDNPEADILGANNANLHSIYVDYEGLPSPFPPTFTVRHLREIEHLL